MIALTIQSYLLTSLCEIVESLQSLKSDAMEDDQEEKNQVTPFRYPKLLSEGTMKENICGDFRINPTKKEHMCDMNTFFFD